MKNHFIHTLPAVAISSLLIMGNVSANEVFAKYCSSCHNKGGNIINPAKTLSKEDLAKNSVDNVGSISALVTTGKPPMPAFGKSLSDEEIKSVAQYVMDQAKAGWK